MKKHSILLLLIVFFALTGCTLNTPTPTPMPNLILQNFVIDFVAQTVSITEKNDGNEKAGTHLTYIEINEVGSPEMTDPQCGHTLHIPDIGVGDTWSSGAIPFANFRCPAGRGNLDLSSLTTANLVIRVDAKMNVDESNELDNISNTNQ